MNEINSNIKIPGVSAGIWLAFPVCVAVVAGTFHNVFSYAAFILSAAAIAAFPEDDALCFLMFLMPFANIFKSSFNSQSFFTYLILFYVLWRFIKNHQINIKFMISFLLLFLFLTAQMMISINVLRTIKFTANLLFIYIAINSDADKDNRKLFLFYILGIAISSCAAALNIIPNLSSYIGAESILYHHVRVYRFTGMYPDPNYYSVNVIISLCLIVILNHKKELSLIPSVCLGALMIVFAGMTLSKSAFLMLLLPAALLLYSKIKKRNYLVFMCSAVLVIIFAVNLFAGRIEMFNAILYRFNKAANAASLTTGRFSIWINYLNYFGENPLALLFGGGFGAEMLGGRAAHNTYIDLLYYLGLVGTALFATVFYSLVNIKKKTGRGNLLHYSIWLCIAAMYFFLSELFYFDWPFHIIIAILAAKTNMDQAQGV